MPTRERPNLFFVALSGNFEKRENDSVSCFQDTESFNR